MTGASDPRDQHDAFLITGVPTQEALEARARPREQPLVAQRPAAGAPLAVPPSNGMAVSSLVLGIVSIVTCLLFLPGIAAVVLGIGGIRQARRTKPPVGKRMSIAGISTGVTSLGIGAVVVASLALAPAANAQVIVDRVVDGDTIDVVRNGETIRVRLLNIDTPETKDPDEPVECLGPEAAEFLTNLLPEGTTVQLEYDDERTDQYGRELAGVFLEDGTFVNAEIARAGLGEAVVYEPNDTYYQQIAAAEEEARHAGDGLFGTEARCTAAAKATQYTKQVTALLDDAPGHDASLDTIDQYTVQLVAQVAAGEKLLRNLNQDVVANRIWADYTGAPVDKVTGHIDRLLAAQGNASDIRERRSKEIRQEREDRRAAEAEREAAASEPADSGGSGSGTSAGSSSGSTSTDDESSSGGSGGMYDPAYTGCRAYRNTGHWLDDQGRRYDKIDCTTKQLIG